MRNGWYERLVEAIGSKKISKRSLSLSAGFGPNFVSQMIKDGKTPGADKLSAILEQLDEETAIYVLLGVKLNEGDVEMLSQLAKLTPASRDAFQAFLDSLSTGEDNPSS